MTSNGPDGGAMTGSGGTRTSDSLSWLASTGSGAVSRTTTSAGHDLLPTGPSTPSAPGIFRTPLTVAEGSHMFSAQYAAGLAVPTTSSLLPYSAGAYARHNQSSLPGPYPYFSQYPTYAPGVLGAHYPSLEHSASYSEELRRMGSQVTQHGMPGMPRSPLFHGGPLAHSFGQLTPTTSPGPSLPQALNTIGIVGHPGAPRRDSKSPPSERHGASPAKEGKPHTKMYSFPTQESKETGYKFKDPHRRSSRPTVTFDTDPPGRHSQSPHHRPLGPPPAKRHKDSTAMGGGEAGPSRRPAAASSAPSHPHYPPHFMKGSIIQLANGQLKYVEDLRTEDFVNSADVSSDLKIDSSTVVRVEEFEDKGTVELGFLVGEHRVQVKVEAALEHPFFVFGQGWSSCSPERTLSRYGLSCQRLQVGDVCISLTHKDANSQAAELSAHRHPANQISESSTDLRLGSSSRTVSETHSKIPQENNRSEAAPGESQRGPSSPASPPSTSHGQDSPHDDGQGQADSNQSQDSLPRKRRWSAPEQISVDSDPEDVPASMSSDDSAPSNSNHGN